MIKSHLFDLVIRWGWSWTRSSTTFVDEVVSSFTLFDLANRAGSWAIFFELESAIIVVDLKVLLKKNEYQQFNYSFFNLIKWRVDPVFHESKINKLYMTYIRMNLSIHLSITFESFAHGYALAYNIIGMHCLPYFLLDIFIFMILLGPKSVLKGVGVN